MKREASPSIMRLSPPIAKVRAQRAEAQDSSVKSAICGSWTREPRHAPRIEYCRCSLMGNIGMMSIRTDRVSCDRLPPAPGRWRARESETPRSLALWTRPSARGNFFLIATMPDAYARRSQARIRTAAEKRAAPRDAPTAIARPQNPTELIFPRMTRKSNVSPLNGRDR